MTSYDITVRCRAVANGDDDVIGIIAAANPVAPGQHPTYLAFIRTPNNTNTDGILSYTHFRACINSVWPNILNNNDLKYVVP
jgi:hypothetical protein